MFLYSYFETLHIVKNTRNTLDLTLVKTNKVTDPIVYSAKAGRKRQKGDSLAHFETFLLSKIVFSVTYWHLRHYHSPSIKRNTPPCISHNLSLTKRTTDPIQVNCFCLFAKTSYLQGIPWPFKLLISHGGRPGPCSETNHTTPHHLNKYCK